MATRPVRPATQIQTVVGLDPAVAWLERKGIKRGWAVTIIFLAFVVILGTLLASVVGGKAGERYHRKVDRAGFTG